MAIQVWRLLVLAAERNELSDNRMWRLSTEGEANLIGGKFDTNVERYRRN